MTRLSDLQVADTEPLGRRGFTFGYKGSDLTVACAKVAEYHRKREVVYRRQAAKYERDLRKSGVTLKEQQVTGGPQFRVDVDPVIAAELGEAQKRRDQHQRDAQSFEAWAGAFRRASDNTFHLTVGDVDYFCLHREPGV